MLGLSLETVGVSLEDLEPSWVELEKVVGGFGGTSIFHALGKRFWNKKAPRGRHFGSQSGAKIDLGSFLEPLEAILGGLRAKFGWFWVTFGPPIFSIFFEAILGAKSVPKGSHFGSQNGTKIDPKSRCKFKSEKNTSCSRLGSILARFPVRLGMKNIDFSLVFIGFRENRRF